MKLGALGALVALALLVVMIGPSEGRRLSMCDLKAELQKQAPRDWGTFTIARGKVPASARRLWVRQDAQVGDFYD